MGAASTYLVNSLVEDILMPLLQLFMATKSWEEATLNLDPIHLAYGSFLAELINFAILALIAFLW